MCEAAELNEVKGFIPVHKDSPGAELIYINYNVITDIHPSNTGSIIYFNSTENNTRVTESVKMIMKLIKSNQILWKGI